MEPLDLRQKVSSSAKATDDMEETEDVEDTAIEPFSNQPSSWKKFRDYFFEIVKIIVTSLIIIVPIRMYVVQPFIVEGDSMAPNFHDGEYLIIDEISYRFNSPRRGDVIIFHPPQNPKTYYIKRIIGLPNETVELKEGKIYIHNDQFPEGTRLNEANYLTKSSINETGEVKLQPDEYYVVGDNRSNSLDSRRFGPLKFSHIKGKALLRAFPFNSFTLFEKTEYFFRNS